MLLTEYDEEQHMRATFEEGYEEGEQVGYSKGEQVGYSKGEQAGYSKGRSSLLAEQIQKKLNRGKTTREIAEDLEVELEEIEAIIKEK